MDELLLILNMIDYVDLILHTLCVKIKMIRRGEGIYEGRCNVKIPNVA